MGTTGRKVVGILNIIHGVTWLIFPLLIGLFVGAISGLISNVPGGSSATGMLLGSGLIIIAIPALIGIFWVVLGVGLFMDQEWAAKLTMIFAILTLIGSFFTCNCIGFIFSIIIIFLVKGEKKKEAKAPERHCTNCGRNIPFDALACPYCGKNFQSHLQQPQPTTEPKPAPVAEPKETKKAEKESGKTEEKPPTKGKKFCPECGNKIEGSPKFCPECGNKV